MIKAEQTIYLPPSHQEALKRAVANLENQDFAARHADYAGRPIMRLMPKAANIVILRFGPVVRALYKAHAKPQTAIDGR